MILGVPNDAAPTLVEGTGLFLAVRKGDRRWVTGTAVAQGLRSGVLVRVYNSDEPPLTDDELALGPVQIPEPATTAPADADLAALHRQHEAVLQGAEPKTAPATAAPGVTVAKKAAPAKKAPAKKAAAKKAAAKKAAAKKR